MATEKLINAAEVGELIGFSVETVRKSFRKMGIPYYKVGGLVKFRASEIEEWLQSKHVEPRKQPKVLVVRKII